MKIGILGGTFNPIHNGHLLIAQNALDQFQLDKVWIMPAGIPPHKQNHDILDSKHRMQMILRAIEDNRSFELNPRELFQSGVSYTYLTLEALKKECPDNEYFFIIGADSLKNFKSWKEPGLILKYATILVAVRDYVSAQEIKDLIKEITDNYGGTIKEIISPEFNVSSCEIRQRINNGHSIKYMLPDSVCEYIISQNLYKD